MEDIIVSLYVAQAKKWKLKSGWYFLFPAAIVYILLFYSAVTLSYGIYFKDDATFSRFYLTMFLICWAWFLPSIKPYYSYSQHLFGETLKLKISLVEKTIVGVFQAKNGNTRSTKIEIEYIKEYPAYFKVGRSFYNFFFVPKASLKKEQIESLRVFENSIKKD